jgi:hypothetical protein
MAPAAAGTVGGAVRGQQGSKVGCGSAARALLPACSGRGGRGGSSGATLQQPQRHMQWRRRGAASGGRGWCPHSPHGGSPLSAWYFFISSYTRSRTFCSVSWASSKSRTNGSVGERGRAWGEEEEAFAAAVVRHALSQHAAPTTCGAPGRGPLAAKHRCDARTYGRRLRGLVVQLSQPGVLERRVHVDALAGVELQHALQQVDGQGVRLGELLGKRHLLRSVLGRHRRGVMVTQLAKSPNGHQVEMPCGCHQNTALRASSHSSQPHTTPSPPPRTSTAGRARM